MAHSKIAVSETLTPEPEKKLLEDKIQNIIATAKKKGASAAEAGGAITTGFTVSVRMGEIETLEHHRDKGISITVFIGQKKGSASTTDLSDTSLDATLEKALNIAKFTSDDPCNGLADPEKMAFQYPDLKLYHPTPISPSDVIDELIECEKLAMSTDARLFNSEGASFSASQGISIYGNSHGFVGSIASTRYDRSLCLIGRDGDSMERDYDFTVSRRIDQLNSIQNIATSTAQKTLARLQPRKLKTAKMPIIFASEIAPGLLNCFFNAIKGGQLYRQASFLCHSLEQQIFPSFITLHENPYLLEGLASTPFDSEGVVTQTRDIVQKGIIKGYILGSYSARKLGMQTTGNAGGLHNIEVSTQSLDLQGLIKQMEKGFLVTDVMGHGVNLVTGDYSRGASGFWVEHGEIQYPVSEVTISSNLKDIFKNIVAIGNDIEYRSAIRTGSILIEEMTVAGN